MAVQGGGDPVAVAIDVDDLPSLRQRVGGGDVHIGEDGVLQGAPLPVPDHLVVGSQPGVEPHLLHRHGPADAHRFPIDLAVQIGGRLICGGEVGGAEAAGLQVGAEFFQICHGDTSLKK